MQMHHHHHHHHHHVHVPPSTLPSHSDEPFPLVPSSSVPSHPSPRDHPHAAALVLPEQEAAQVAPHRLRSLFRSLPIFTPAAACRFPSARITLAIQDSPGTVPLLLLELATPTGKFMQEMGSGEHIRIALECEKVAEHKKSTTTTTTERRRQLLEEPLWTAYVNGRKIGYAVRREPTEDDLTVMQLLHTVSVGAGVLPSDVVMDPATQATATWHTCARTSTAS
uniref:Protein MIZU-KUSSEI 1 n=1 Tax=Ananas comosus var. bracteatus TaxID=296719 RepID=A0A6V7PFB2_ANACO|nr:unnamed protein product [Ananas comosus var. bracteatus]